MLVANSSCILADMATSISCEFDAESTARRCNLHARDQRTGLGGSTVVIGHEPRRRGIAFR